MYITNLPLFCFYLSCFNLNGICNENITTIIMCTMEILKNVYKYNKSVNIKVNGIYLISLQSYAQLTAQELVFTGLFSIQLI